MNKLTIIGNLTRDPEIRDFGDSRVCNFTVAVNRRGRSDHPEADYFRVSVWNALGESCAKYLNKGKKVCVIGPVRAGVYTDRNGESRASLEIKAEDVEFLTPRGQGEPAPDEQVDAQSGMTRVDDEDCPY